MVWGRKGRKRQNIDKQKVLKTLQQKYYNGLGMEGEDKVTI